MRYYDKKRQRLVALAASEGEYLVKFKEGQQGESLIKSLSFAEPLLSVKWIPFQSVATVSFNKRMTKSSSFINTLNEIREEESVEDVIPVFKDEERFQRLIVPGCILAAYKSGSQNDLKDKLVIDKISVLKMSRFGNWMVLGLRDGEMIEDAIAYYNEMREVDYAEPVYYGVNDNEDVEGSFLPWNLQDINIAEAWEETSGRDNILIAIIDGMPDVNHPSIQSSFPSGVPSEWDFSNSQNKSSHSTQILGILAGNSDLLKGISPGTSIAPLAVTLEAQYYYQRAEAIYFLAEVARQGNIGMRTVSKVIANCSWKTSGDVAVIRNAIETAAQNGVIFVTSAGNESSAGPHYPSDYSKTIEGVFSVAALAPNNRKASYSNYSTTVSICAPGGDGSPLDSNDIYCADLNNTHAYTAGTSFAAPHLSGTIALMLSISPRMSFGDIKDILEKTALSLKAENPELYPLLGCGKLDAGKAVKAAADQTMPSQPRQPENPEDPANHEVPGNSEQPAGDILGPKIDIVIGNENLTTSTSTAPANETCIDRMTERVGDELRNMSSSLENGDFVRITLESNGSVTILDYQI